MGDGCVCVGGGGGVDGDAMFFLNFIALLNTSLCVIVTLALIYDQHIEHS